MALVGILGAGQSGVVMGIQLKRLGIDDRILPETPGKAGRAPAVSEGGLEPPHPFGH